MFKVLQSLTESRLDEAFRHIRKALVLNVNHLGDRAENPDGFRELQNVLKLFDIKVPETKLYVYDSVEYPREFLRVMKAQKVTQPDAPEMVNLKNAGFELAKRSMGITYFQKGDIIVALEKDKAPVLWVKGGTDPLVSESLTEAPVSIEQAALLRYSLKLQRCVEQLDKLVYLDFDNVETLLKNAGFPDHGSVFDDVIDAVGKLKAAVATFDDAVTQKLD